MSRVLLFMAMEFVVFALASVNQRATAKDRTGAAVMTDMLIAGFGFCVIKLVVDAETPWEMAGYVLGAGLGLLRWHVGHTALGSGGRG